jgi:hypothetical protein
MDYRAIVMSANFPPRPTGLRGRTAELATLDAIVRRGAPPLALVGGGGSGKSILAAALGHRLAARFDGRIDWFRIGRWDPSTLFELFARRFGTRAERDARVAALRRHFGRSPRLIVLDNHEDDRSTARLLEAFRDTQATFVITARRCLLAGVLVYPVTAPLVTAGGAAFPRVASLTRVLRWNPLALDIADGIVASRAAGVRELRRALSAAAVEEIRPVAHEDDLPEVAALIDWCLARLSPAARRMLATLAHVEGDHVDLESLATLSRVRGDPRGALAPLRAFRLVQEPLAERFALHAVVRYAIARRTPREAVDLDAIFEHYVGLLERAPERLPLEQTNLFAAMDHAHRKNDLDGLVRIERLLAQIDAAPRRRRRGETAT